ncbi:hypothetical protein [Pseudomonas sp.]|uniref:hypothetical protein n=1 Tax=Pseudomonas sp. TaxID=306 RepID=UPI0028A61E8E|nr:hypothetical protein [Pseudomonas sp.]
MARTSSSDTPKAPATAAAEAAAATPPATAPASNTAGAAVVADSNVAAGTQTGPVQPADTANTDSASPGAATVSLDAKTGPADQVQADDDSADQGEITIYPLRSYLDGKEVRRAGGAGYKSPKHDAVSLIAAGLATDKKPKA